MRADPLARLSGLRASGHLMPGRGPLLRPADGAPESVRSALQAGWRSGVLVRLSRGTFLPLDLWASAAPWDRFTLCAAAHASAADDVVFTGATAAHLHGLPLARTPDALHRRARRRGHPGRRPLTSSPWSAAAPARSPGRRLPAPPAVAFMWNPPNVPGPDGDPEHVPIALADRTPLGTVAVDPLPSVQLQLGAALAFREAVVPLDALLRRCLAMSQRWAEQHADVLPTRAARERFDRAWSFADARAESPGESLSRALIHELGFARPELQHTMFDAAGRQVARVDFWWEEAGVVGEFDGIGKYDIDLHADEASRRRSIRREATREQELRRITRRVVHWTWDDLTAPERLARELTEAGVPRRRG